MRITTAGKQLVDLDRAPNSCPMCHNSIAPRYVIAMEISYQWEPTVLQAVFHCPNAACRQLFLAYYEEAGYAEYQCYALVKVAPTIPKAPDLPKEVADLSPMFQTTYAQAVAAEVYRLDELSGMGYRKALEYLIKDFCIHKYPDEQDEIRKTLLKPAIVKFVDDSRVKAAAIRATYLGNDETHYERRWANFDIEDLKRLLAMTVNYVHNELMAEHYEAEMPA